MYINVNCLSPREIIFTYHTRSREHCRRNSFWFLMRISTVIKIIRLLKMLITLICCSLIQNKARYCFSLLARNIITNCLSELLNIIIFCIFLKSLFSTKQRLPLKRYIQYILAEFMKNGEKKKKNQMIGFQILLLCSNLLQLNSYWMLATSCKFWIQTLVLE